MKRYRFYKAAACTPHTAIGDPFTNVQNILDVIEKLSSDTQLAVFPELCLSGYTAQDLFYEELLLNQCLEALEELTKKVPDNLSVLVGLPLQVGNRLFNAAAFIFNHEVLGFSIKTYLPNYNEYYEKRWFSSANELSEGATVSFMGKEVPCSNRLIYADKTTGAKIAAEICEDLWVSIPQSSKLALAGANVLANLSASNETISKADYREDLVISQSARTYSAYIYASAGPDESSSDLVFSGEDLIAENGHLLAKSPLFKETGFVEAILDLSVINTERLHFKTSFEESYEGIWIHYHSKKIDEIEMNRFVDAYPFVPSDLNARFKRCESILQMQTRGLATRLEKIHCENCVIGISGGLDSTLALLVTYRAYKLLGLSPKGIHAITMPGFGTSKRTKTNAETLMELLGVSIEKISIVPSVLQHFEDINHDKDVLDITYENSQARERTQILMDLANKYNGIVVGTGDLSELALGWCTYNGDHMSMYAVNTSIPKTLVRYLVETVAAQAKNDGNDALSDVLIDICNTPVSPELLPLNDKGEIEQKTEEVLGSYDLHDFFLYHMLRYHEEPQKIFDLACVAFNQIDKETILKALKTFYWRFFSQQFKRNCLPDGVKVGSVNLSPRGDWRMPSDATNRMWKEQVEAIKI